MVIQLDVLERHSLQGIVAYKPIKSIQKLPSLATEITQKYWRVYWRPILQHELFDTVGSYCYCQQTAFKSNYAEEKNFAWLPCTYYRIWCIYRLNPSAAFTVTPGYMLPRIQVVSTCIHLLPSTRFLYRRQNCRPFVAWHKGIQVDRDINE